MMPQDRQGSCWPPRAADNSHRIKFSEAQIHSNLKVLCELPTNDSNTSSPRFSDEKITSITRWVEYLDRIAKREDRFWWSHRPRIFAVLFALDATSLMESVVRCGINDICLPFNSQTVPDFVTDRGLKEAFLRGQKFVLSRHKDIMHTLEIKREHVTFSTDADVHFDSPENLGSGGFGSVDKVCSRLTREWYARKKMHRQSDSKKGREHQKYIEQEISILRKSSHRHLIRIGGSYTDPTCIAYLMEPLADLNLLEFLERHNERPGVESAAERKALRSFFGCLAAAVHYLHVSGIRHRDLKPQNVLVKGNAVYLSDFGTALDWSVMGQDATQDRGVPFTRAYIAPEVASGWKKGKPSDMWSLGLIFLDIFTVLRGFGLAQWQSFLCSRARADYRDMYPYDNVTTVFDWLGKLSEPAMLMPRDKQPVSWIQQLLLEEPASRLESKGLNKEISESTNSNEFSCWQCQTQFRKELSNCSQNNGQGDKASQISRTNETPQVPSEPSSYSIQTADPTLRLTDTEGTKSDRTMPTSSKQFESGLKIKFRSRAPSVVEENIEMTSLSPDINGNVQITVNNTNGDLEKDLFNTIDDMSTNGEDDILIGGDFDLQDLDLNHDLRAILEDDEEPFGKSIKTRKPTRVFATPTNTMYSPQTVVADSNLLTVPTNPRCERRRARSASPSQSYTSFFDLKAPVNKTDSTSHLPVPKVPETAHVPKKPRSIAALDRERQDAPRPSSVMENVLTPRQLCETKDRKPQPAARFAGGHEKSAESCSTVPGRPPLTSDIARSSDAKKVSETCRKSPGTDSISQQAPHKIPNQTSRTSDSQKASVPNDPRSAGVSEKSMKDAVSKPTSTPSAGLSRGDELCESPRHPDRSTSTANPPVEPQKVKVQQWMNENEVREAPGPGSQSKELPKRPRAPKERISEPSGDS